MKHIFILGRKHPWHTDVVYRKSIFPSICLPKVKIAWISQIQLWATKVTGDDVSGESVEWWLLTPLHTLTLSLYLSVYLSLSLSLPLYLAVYDEDHYEAVEWWLLSPLHTLTAWLPYQGGLVTKLMGTLPWYPASLHHLDRTSNLLATYKQAQTLPWYSPPTLT